MSNQVLLKEQAVEKIDREHTEKLYSKANDFFKPAALHALAAEAPQAQDDAYVSDQGMVQFHLIGQKPADKKYSKIMNDNQDNLLGMGGLVHSYMQNKYPKADDKLDIKTWADVVGRIPCLTTGSFTEKKYSNSIAGVSVSSEFLSIVATAIITEGASLLFDFQKFLNGIGDVAFSVHHKGESYNVLTCTYQSYLVDNMVGGYYDYGAIVLRQITFSENFLELRSCCSKTDLVNVKMDYTEMTNLIQTRRIRKGGEDYKNFQKLINKDQTKQFEDAQSFFNGGNTPQDEIKPTV